MLVADAVGLVEEVISVAQRLLCVLIDRNGDRLDVLIAVALARGTPATPSVDVKSLHATGS
jgi:hypothetical protein